MTHQKNKIVVMGDAHVSNGQSLRRFTWLNQYLKDIKPTHLVIIGDFLTLNTLSAWDRDKRYIMEGKRYQLEIDAGNLALDLINPSNEIEKIFIEGNHEDRLTRYFNQHPEFSDGSISIPANLKLAERGYKWVQYRDYTSINGIHFTHIPFGKAKEISGKDICSRAEGVTVHSVVFGHTHELHTSCVHKTGMKHLQQILNVGCFFEKEEEYVKGRMTNYWKGIVTLENYDYGRFDISTISMGRLQREYS